MPDDRPPTIDPAAAQHWARRAPAVSPWLHEEVGRRMEERLEWIKREPATWVDWEPVRGGLEAHARVSRRYPKARVRVVEPLLEARAREKLAPPLWQRLRGASVQFGPAPDGEAQMLWSNMRLHTSAEPQALLAQWQRALAVDGFLMFSCLGPDTLRELRALYASLGWPPPSHEFTDMHDWGDMLVQGGFAEPVMDMERITLTFATPQRLLAELRELGANLHPQRFPALRGQRWRAALEQALDRGLRGADGQLALTFEVVYGHALKAAPRVKVGEQSAFSVDDLRGMLQRGRQ
jgi:malonyl-CoA O-methyltransferase